MMLLTSLAIAIGGGFFAVGLSIFLILLGFYSSLRSRRIVQSWLTGLLFVPTFVIAGAWTAGFGLQGWWPIWIPGFSPVAVAGKPVWAVLVVIWIYGVSLVPLAFMLLRLGLRSGNYSAWSLAQMEGGVWIGLRQGFWPGASAWAGVVIGLLAGFVSTDMFVTNLFQINTITERSYQDILSGKNSSGMMLISSLVSWTLILVLSASQLLRPFSSPPSTNRQAPAISGMIVSRSTRRISEGLLWTTIGLVSIIPWTNLILKAGWVSFQHEQAAGLMKTDLWALAKGFAPVRHQWSLLQAARVTMQAPFAFAEEFYWSGCLGAVSAIVALVIGVPLVLGVRRIPSFFGGLITLLLAAAFFMPGPAVNLIVLRLMQSDWLTWWNDNTLIAPILCLQFRLIPIAAGWTYWFVSQWRQRYDGIWAVDKALPIHARLRILMLPVGWSIARLWLIMFVVSFSDLSTYLLCLPPGVTTISMRVFDLLHYGVRFQEAGLLLFIALLGLFVGFANSYSTRFLSSSRASEENTWL